MEKNGLFFFLQKNEILMVRFGKIKLSDLGTILPFVRNEHANRQFMISITYISRI